MPGAPVRGRRRQSVADQQREVEAAVGGGRIPFVDFLKILLDFQLNGHEKFLSKFRRYFLEVDSDKNGVVNELQFRNLVRRIDPGKSADAIENLMMLVDPYNNQHITFSEAVGALSSELVSVVPSPVR